MSYFVPHVWEFTHSNLLELMTILQHCPALLYYPLSNRDFLPKPTYLNKKRCNRTIALTHMKAHC